MKKDRTRDYATAAFRTYAALGKPKYEELKSRIYKDALSGRNPQRALLQAEKAVCDKSALLADIMAVNRTLELLEQGGKGHIIAAVEAVYFVRPEIPITKKVITERVKRVAYEMPAAERSVFYWLREARLLFADIRGLYTDDI